MQSKVIIITSLVLVVIPFVVFFFLDFNNLPMGERISAALFHAVTPRTAGFNMVDFSTMTHGGIAITMILMLIGGSPGSTAGGMKTTTFAVLFSSALSVFRKKEHTHFFGRRLPDGTERNAATIALMYLMLFLTSGMIISRVERLPLLPALFESASAIGTVGLSLGITPGLGLLSRMILIVLMFFGRVGGLTLIFAVFSKLDSDHARYPQEKITVG